MTVLLAHVFRIVNLEHASTYKEEFTVKKIWSVAPATASPALRIASLNLLRAYRVMDLEPLGLCNTL